MITVLRTIAATCGLAARPAPRGAAAPRAHRAERGYSLVELLLTLMMISFLVLPGIVIWRETRARSEITSAARMFKLFVYQARMQAIYSGVPHFVTIDSAGRQLEIYSDEGTTPDVLDVADRRVAATNLAASVALTLPTEPSTLTNPFGGGNLTAAWPLPTPSGGAWNGRMGLVVTPTGLIQTIEGTPAIVNNAVVVFSNGTERTAAVGIRGRLATLAAFEWFDGTWRER